MTLKTQLALAIAVLFLVSFLGVSFISISHVRLYLENELAANDRNTAAMLAKSLPAEFGNRPALNAALDEFMRQGEYREIAVVSAAGETVALRKSEGKVSPGWFAALVKLEAPRAEAATPNGGKIYVESDPARLYGPLWESILDELLWLAIAAGAATLVGFAAIHGLANSLAEVEELAIAIVAHEYPENIRLPATRELRQLVEVMSRVAKKEVRMFREQTALAEKLNAESCLDPLTGLGNRRHFERKLEHLIRSPEEFYYGVLLLLGIRNFTLYNNKEGFAAGDALLCRLGEILDKIASKTRGSLLAHLSGADFALVLPDVKIHDAESIALKILDALAAAFPQGIHDGETGHIGAAVFTKGMEARQLVSAAHEALVAAQAEGPLGWKLHHGHARAPEARGTEYWRKLFVERARDKAVRLQYQPVYGIGEQRMIHHEVFIRIVDDKGAMLPAGVFMPLAQSHGFATELDRIALEKLLPQVAAAENDFAFNLSLDSALDASFIDWLEQELDKIGSNAQRLFFEFREYDLATHQEKLREPIKKLAARGAGIGVDHSGRGFVSFGYLGTLKIDYLKIDGSLVRGIDRAKANQFLVMSIARIAHELDIKIIAESVETYEERATLSELYLDALQGYLIGKPGDGFQPP